MISELKIEMLGSPVLRQRAETVDAVDDDLRRLVQDMFVTMYGADGQGLAAPQVGILRRIIVLDVKQRDTRPYALVNPKVVESSAETARAEEGCLSIPGVSEVVERPARVVVEALDPEGTELVIDADGPLARCLQHEIDHLDGILYLDRLSPLKRRMVLQRYRKAQ